LGMTKPKGQSNYVIHGKRMSGWVVRKKFGTRNLVQLREIDEDAIKIPLTSKYRYVFVQADRKKRRELKSALTPFVLPYPTRIGEGIPPMNVMKLVRDRSLSKTLPGALWNTNRRPVGAGDNEGH
jgi:hypothetical protein